MEVDRGNYLRIHAPEWFEREDLKKYMDFQSKPAHIFPAASWGYAPHGWEPGEFSDIFITFDHGDGSNSDLPDDIWQVICSVADLHDFKYGIIWISPV